MLAIYEEVIYTVGQEILLSSGVDSSNAVVFEDNGETGYFYAISRENGIEILDALHIYGVGNVVDKDIPSQLKILWTEDEMKAILSINNYYHAVFDFQNQAGYCRNAYPNPHSSWTKVKERKLTDRVIEKLAG